MTQQEQLQAMRDAEAAFLEARRDRARIEPTPEQVQAEVEYWHRVFAPRQYRPSLNVVQRRNKEMEYEDARHRLWAILKFRAAEIISATGRDFNFHFQPEQLEVIRGMIRYFINDPASPYALEKGLFVYGDNGTGKTEIMHAFSRFCEQYDLSKKFRIVQMPDVYRRAQSGEDVAEQYQQQTTCFDEFARVTGTVLQYGNPVNPNESILEARYLRFKRYGQITHLIANATPGDITGTNSVLSPAVQDRIREMFTPVLYPGKSHRK